MYDTSTKRMLRTHQIVARQIGVAVLSGEYPPGHCFDAEIESAEAIGVSRTAYREALRILVAKGLLESRPKVGTQVTPRRQWNLLDPDVLAWMFSGTPAVGYVRDLFELRGVVEPAAAAFAAERYRPEHLEAMDHALAEMKVHGLATDEGRQADQRFHTSILEATDNDLLISLSSSISAAVRWTTWFKRERMPSPRDPIKDHEVLRDAIAERDADKARATMHALLQLALEDMGNAFSRDAGDSEA
jgi:DNA-binding FadR family transcriptional regulator